MRMLSLSLLLAACCLGTHASAAQPATALNADEQEIATEFSAMTALADPLGIRFRTRMVIDAQDGDNPVAMGYEDGTCTLVVRVRGNSLYQRLILARDGHPRDLKLRAILAHEMGHCFRHFFARGARAAPGSADRVAERAAEPAPDRTPDAAADRRQRRDSEDQADLFALAWAAIYNPGEADEVRAYLIEVRKDLCADRSGRYGGRRELDRDARYLSSVQPEPGLLVQIATVHARTGGAAAAAATTPAD